jgi:CRISPR-associated protein Csm2
MANFNIKFGSPLSPDLFSSTAQEEARRIAGDERSNKPTQLRRFYDELVLWETRTSQQPGKFAEYLPFIRMMNAKAAYAEGRKLVNPDFVALMSHTLDQVKDPETLTHCKLFWEAFLGFYKQVRPKD